MATNVFAKRYFVRVLRPQDVGSGRGVNFFGKKGLAPITEDVSNQGDKVAFIPSPTYLSEHVRFLQETDLACTPWKGNPGSDPGDVTTADTRLLQWCEKNAIEVYSKADIDAKVIGALDDLPARLLSDTVLAEVREKLRAELDAIEAKKAELRELQTQISTALTSEMERLVDAAIERIRNERNSQGPLA